MSKASISLVLGDPAGIGPELVAKVLSQPAYRTMANIIIIADRRELEKGMEIAGVRFPYREITQTDSVQFTPGEPVLLNHDWSQRTPFDYGNATEQRGVYILETLKKAVELTQQGVTSGICFAPLNKQAMHMGGLQHRDELHWFAELLNFKGFCCEVNVVDDLWAGRATSHIPFRDIVSNLNIEGITDTIALMDRTLRQAGISQPKIAVQALNPHGGENGLFGDEEQTIIKPAIAKAKAQGMDVYGPYPGDTTYKAVETQQLNAVVSMYHDQFATALKMLGFERGITVQGGLPIPIATANHGTAYNLYGQGCASPSAFENAFKLLVKMAEGAQQ